MQDFDIIFLVDELVSVQTSPGWIDIFGERIILQMPNSMQLDDYEEAFEAKNVIEYIEFIRERFVKEGMHGDNQSV